MTRALTALLLLAAAGCAPASHQRPPIAPSTAPPTDSAAGGSSTPPKDAAELNARVLSFLGHAAGASALSREEVERGILALEAQGHDPQVLGAWGKLDAVWSYTLELRVDAPSGHKILTLTYVGDDNANMGAVCTPDFEGFVTALTDAGYTYDDVYGEHGRFLAGSFARGDAQLKVYPRGVSNEDAAHLCAQRLILETP